MQIMHNLFFQFIFIKVFYLLLVIYETMNNALCVTSYVKIAITVESLEFVVAQFSWNSWVPLIHEFTSSTKQKEVKFY